MATLCPAPVLWGPINTSHSLEGGRARRVGPSHGPPGGGGGCPGLATCRFMCSARWSERREGTVAQVALEGPVARVLAARELVRSRELPAAAFPVAVVGPPAVGEGESGS